MPPRTFIVALTPLLDDRFIDSLFLLAGHGHDVAVIECAPPDGREERSEAAGVAQRIWDATRQMIRDTLVEHGIAVATWRQDGHLALTLHELTRRRQRIIRAGHR